MFLLMKYFKNKMFSKSRKPTGEWHFCCAGSPVPQVTAWSRRKSRLMLIYSCFSAWQPSPSGKAASPVESQSPSDQFLRWCDIQESWRCSCVANPSGFQTLLWKLPLCSPEKGFLLSLFRFWVFVSYFLLFWVIQSRVAQCSRFWYTVLSMCIVRRYLAFQVKFVRVWICLGFFSLFSSSPLPRRPYLHPLLQGY